MDTDMPDPAPAVDPADVASTSALRRRVLGAGLIGLAGSLVPSLAARAGASPDQATTTTAPPKRPSEADLELLRFAQAAELAAQALYTTAIASGLGPTTEAVVTLIRDHHQAYGQALGAEIGRTAPGAPDEALLDELSDAFGGGQEGMLAAAVQLENTLVATHTELIGTLTGIDGAKLIASIVITEARHVVALADLAGATELDDFLLNDATALTPAEG